MITFNCKKRLPVFAVLGIAAIGLAGRGAFVGIAGPTDLSVSVNGSGDVAWSNPTNVYSNNSAWATCQVDNGEDSEYLRMTDFAYFDETVTEVPEESWIDGIRVTLIGKDSSSGSPNESGTLHLTLNGSLLNLHKAYQPFNSGSDVTKQYGGSSDLWIQGNPVPFIDPAVINDPDFGVSLQIHGGSVSSSSYTAEINYCTMTVWFTPPGPGKRQHLTKIVRVGRA